VSTVYHFHREQWLPAPPSEVFRFFSDARHLELLTPRWVNLRVLNPDAIEMKVGAEIHYELHWCFLPLQWKTAIVEWKPPEYFVDQQAGGPYRFWRHTHAFQVEGDGTRMFDSVEYELPFGFLGRLLHAAKGRRDLDRIFDYRANAIRLIFSAESKMAKRA